MDEWQASFEQKSEKRRRRSTRRRWIRRIKLVVFISLAILAGLWIVNESTNGPDDDSYTSVGHIRHR